MYCMNCGNEIDEIHQICHGCGVRIGEHKKRMADTQKKKIEDNDRITDTIKKKHCENCGSTMNDNIGSIVGERIAPIKTRIIPCTMILPNVVTDPKKSGIAAVLSFFIPGLGQIYHGRIGIGSLFLISEISLLGLSRLLVISQTVRDIIPDIRQGMIPGIRETIPDIRIILFAIIYVILWIYNMHHAYAIDNAYTIDVHNEEMIERYL